MIKAFVIPTVIFMVIFFIFYGWVFNFPTDERLISDVFFYAGLPSLFISIILLTHATSLFKGLKYVFLRMFTNVHNKYPTYREYKLNEKEKQFNYGVLTFTIWSVISITISLIYAMISMG